MNTSSVVIEDSATPGLRASRELVQRPRALMGAVGKRVEKEYRGHFLARDRQGNRRGWARTHFWNKVRTATSLTHFDEAGATLTIASPEFVHKVTGGTVTPKRGKFLALPATARAAAAGSPREGGIPGLFVIGRRGGKGLYLAIKEGGAIRVMYRLLASVTHRPDPEATIAAPVLARHIEDETAKYMSRELARIRRAKA